MRLPKLASLLAVTLLLPSALSFADSSKTTFKQNVAELKKACKADAKKLCSDVTPGEGRIMACFDSKSDQLSAGCKKELTTTQASISEKMDKANLAFRKNCGGDVNKFCSDIPQGRGRILDCLNSHEDSLSQSCKDVQAQLRQKAEEYLG